MKVFSQLLLFNECVVLAYVGLLNENLKWPNRSAAEQAVMYVTAESMQYFADSDSTQRSQSYRFILHSCRAGVQFLSSFLLLEILDRANRSDSTQQGRNVCADVTALHSNSLNPFFFHFCICLLSYFLFEPQYFGIRMCLVLLQHCWTPYEQFEGID